MEHVRGEADQYDLNDHAVKAKLRGKTLTNQVLQLGFEFTKVFVCDVVLGSSSAAHDQGSPGWNDHAGGKNRNDHRSVRGLRVLLM